MSAVSLKLLVLKTPQLDRLRAFYQALGIEEVILLCAVGPAQHQEVLNTIRLFGEQIIPRFQAKAPRAAVA